jgi:hypothetical protein
MGDLVAAVGAAAHAAIVYRRQDRRASALWCSTRAEALAERCGGVSAPALRQASERLPSPHLSPAATRESSVPA